MNHRLIASALGASMLAPGAAALAEPYLSPGITLVGTTGDGPMSGFSMGTEITVNSVDPYSFYDDIHYGALLQIEFDFAGHMRINAGGQMFSGHLPLGAELAYSMTIGGDEIGHAGMLAPFTGFGFVNLAGRLYIGAGGLDAAAALSLKAPLGLFGDVSSASVVEGRPLRDADGRAHKPAVVTLGRRARPRAAADLPPASRAALGRAWLESARDEHAAVDAFRKLARQLRRRGAPPALVRRALRSARDERRHARGCLDIAEALLGRRLALISTPLPDGPTPDRAALARESRLDGVVAEGAAARLAAIGARRSTIGPVARLQGAIAREEAGHAALGAAIEGWAVETGGASVRAALIEARPADADAIEPGPRAPAGDAALWRRWGRTSVAERRDAWHAASA